MSDTAGTGHHRTDGDAHEHVAREPVAQEPVVRASATREPAAHGRAAQERAVHEPAARESATRERAAGRSPREARHQGARGSAHETARDSARETAHEAYSFACMRCGHGWEQAYDIAHRRDVNGREYVVYTTDGRQVPSPLTQPTCAHCGGHVVRIMRAGRVSSVLDSMQRESVPATRPASPARAARRTGASRAASARTGATDSGARRAGAPRTGSHLWHVSSLMRLLHLHRRPR